MGAFPACAEQLGGGWSALIRAVHLNSGQVARRSMVRPEAADRAADMLAREARTLTMPASTAIPAPQLPGVDPSGANCTWPALLVTRLPARSKHSHNRISDAAPKN